MIERFLSKVRVAGPFTEIAPEELKRLRANFSPLAARRLALLPLLIGEVLSEATLAAEDDVIFASAMAGVIGMEKYLASFPTPSPMLFQSSVHGGPVELVLVARQQPVRCVVPMSGGAGLLFNALRAAIISTAPTVHITGGEEGGTWTHEHKISGDVSFAFYARLRSDPESAAARLTLDPEKTTLNPLSLEAFCGVLARRESIEFGVQDVGGISLEWI